MGKSIDTKINDIAKSSADLRVAVQSIGLEIGAAMLEKGNDANPIYLTKLMAALGSSTNRKSLRVWLETFLPVTMKEAKEGTKDTFTVDRKVYVFGMKKVRSYRLEDMAEVNWWEATKDTTDQPITLDVDKAILAILKKAENANSVVHGEKLEALKALVEHAA
jgi:hypothetical protein